MIKCFRDSETEVAPEDPSRDPVRASRSRKPGSATPAMLFHQIQGVTTQFSFVEMPVKHFQILQLASTGHLLASILQHLCWFDANLGLHWQLWKKKSKLRQVEFCCRVRYGRVKMFRIVTGILKEEIQLQTVQKTLLLGICLRKVQRITKPYYKNHDAEDSISSSTVDGQNSAITSWGW